MAGDFTNDVCLSGWDYDKTAYVRLISSIQFHLDNLTLSHKITVTE